MGSESFIIYFNPPVPNTIQAKERNSQFDWGYLLFYPLLRRFFFFFFFGGGFFHILLCFFVCFFCGCFSSGGFTRFVVVVFFYTPCLSMSLSFLCRMLDLDIPQYSKLPYPNPLLLAFPIPPSLRHSSPFPTLSHPLSKPSQFPIPPPPVPSQAPNKKKKKKKKPRSSFAKVPP